MHVLSPFAAVLETGLQADTRCKSFIHSFILPWPQCMISTSQIASQHCSSQTSPAKVSLLCFAHTQLHSVYFSGESQLLARTAPTCRLTHLAYMARARLLCRYRGALLRGKCADPTALQQDNLPQIQPPSRRAHLCQRPNLTACPAQALLKKAAGPESWRQASSVETSTHARDGIPRRRGGVRPGLPARQTINPKEF